MTDRERRDNPAPDGELPEELEKEVDRQVTELIGEDGGLGYCHLFWAEKKRILRERYGIDWKTPAERYPGVIFD